MKISSFAVMTTSLFIVTGIHAASISGQGTWESTLQGRDLDGNMTTFEAYYDTSLNITWLADANYAKTINYVVDGQLTWYVEGPMTWPVANAWAAGLDPYNSGITGWRLPTVTDKDGIGCQYSYSGTDCGYNVDTTTSEMSYMFYVTLGNTAYRNSSGVVNTLNDRGLSNTALFSNLQAAKYWSSTSNVGYYNSAWTFDFSSGSQYHDVKNFPYYAWVVHSGDVGAPVVPVPAAALLFLFGLIGLFGFAKRKAHI